MVCSDITFQVIEKQSSSGQGGDSEVTTTPVRAHKNILIAASPAFEGKLK